MDYQSVFLTRKEQEVLHDALYYMKMDELKKACLMLSLPRHGKKIELIRRIMTFVQTGTITKDPVVPTQSRTENYPLQSLSASSLMLYGHYKNDAKTRVFFKQLIGPHFHFTAFGIDWLTDRWLQGKPPTYQEFADYWIAETEQRTQQMKKPKKEWQYITFLQNMSAEQPTLSKNDIMIHWKQLQADKAREAFEILKLVMRK